MLLLVAVLVNFVRLTEFQDSWTTGATGVVSLLTPSLTPPPLSSAAIACSSMDLMHLDPLFAAHAPCITQPELVAVLRTLVVTAAQLFAAHNITYFLDSGTLLGAFRDQRVIAYDTDADTAIDAAGFEYIRRQRIDVAEPFLLTVYASGDLYPGSQRDKGIPIRLVHKATARYVDVFVFETQQQDDDQHVVRSPSSQGEAVELVGPYPSWAFAQCAHCTDYYNQGKQLLVPRD